MFVSIFGRKRFGHLGVRIDNSENVFVETDFFHIGFLPIVPLQSYLVVDPDQPGYEPESDIRTSLQFRSVCMAWIETILKFVAVSGLFVAIIGSVAAGSGVIAGAAGLYFLFRSILCIRSSEPLGPAWGLARIAQIVHAREFLIRHFATSSEKDR